MNRPTLLCLHSSASSPRQWAALSAAAGSDWQVVTPPLPGYGEAPATDPADGMSAYITHVHAVVGNSPGPVHLVGHSMGGALALRYAMRHPDRIASLTVYESVCFDLLFGPAALNEAADEINHVGNLLQYRVRRGQAEAAAELFMDYWNGSGAWAATPAPARKRLAGRMPAVAREFHALFACLPDPRAYAALGPPLQILRGDRSPEPARQVASRLAVLVPGSVLRDLAGLGHMGPITHPERVNPMILGFAADTLVGATRVA